MSSVERKCMSSHGDTSEMAPSGSPSKTNSPTIVCIHVVPDFGGPLMTMSPARRGNVSHRLVSDNQPRYRTISLTPCLRQASDRS